MLRNVAGDLVRPHGVVPRVGQWVHVYQGMNYWLRHDAILNQWMPWHMCNSELLCGRNLTFVGTSDLILHGDDPLGIDGGDVTVLLSDVLPEAVIEKGPNVDLDEIATPPTPNSD